MENIPIVDRHNDPETAASPAGYTKIDIPPDSSGVWVGESLNKTIIWYAKKWNINSLLIIFLLLILENSGTPNSGTEGIGAG